MGFGVAFGLLIANAGHCGVEKNAWTRISLMSLLCVCLWSVWTLDRMKDFSGLGQTNKTCKCYETNYGYYRPDCPKCKGSGNIGDHILDVRQTRTDSGDFVVDYKVRRGEGDEVE